MDLLPDEEQQAIIDQTARFLESELPLARFHELGGQPEELSDEIWKTIAKLGWFGLGIPEAQGGVGFTLAEESLLVRELGRVLAPPTLVATLLGARCAALCDAVALRDASLAGEVRVAWAQSRVEFSLGPGGAVSGRFHVFDPGGATHLLLLDASGARLIEARGLGEARVLECLDESVGLAEVELDGASVLAFLENGADSIRARASLLVSALLVGQCEATRDDAVAYAKERVQFGKPIGVFQAVKHPCADMAVGCEAALSQLVRAALVVRDGLADGLFQATAAKLVAARTAVKSAERNVQIHGGYGFTTEYDAHLFVKRAHLLDGLAGSQRELTQVLLAEKPPH